MKKIKLNSKFYAGQAASKTTERIGYFDVVGIVGAIIRGPRRVCARFRAVNVKRAY